MPLSVIRSPGSKALRLSKASRVKGSGPAGLRTKPVPVPLQPQLGAQRAPTLEARHCSSKHRTRVPEPAATRDSWQAGLLLQAGSGPCPCQALSRHCSVTGTVQALGVRRCAVNLPRIRLPAWQHGSLHACTSGEHRLYASPEPTPQQSSANHRGSSTWPSHCVHCTVAS